MILVGIFATLSAVCAGTALYYWCREVYRRNAPEMAALAVVFAAAAAVTYRLIQ